MRVIDGTRSRALFRPRSLLLSLYPPLRHDIMLPEQSSETIAYAR